ncbi:hypothetical protein IB232_13695 [Pseudomonas sp. PDM15]|uniref:hypothetical protein n=1 Tax=Pseudomonas sp. PDM15 TaxID=2769303 RepID=UPI0017830B05|nr:hypothetical protein [Pseudomonas sp. PDM15]MBD9426384.1 hypothetical protein [Pseudomonas sp. PDM15]
MQLIEWIRRRRRERTRVLFIAQTMGGPPETAALTWMTRRALFGFTATLFQIAGVIPLILTLLKLCLEFPSLSYWPQMLVIMGSLVVSFWLLLRYREVWALTLAAFYLAFAVVLLDFAVAKRCLCLWWIVIAIRRLAAGLWTYPNSGVSRRFSWATTATGSMSPARGYG